jgi:flavin reductase (DIM6/NTAB) family NADH-FMN oxidoreductase RutF
MSEPASYGGLLSALWTPIVAVSAAHDGRASAQIAVSAHGASIVPDRPRVLVLLWKTNLTHDLALASRAFGLHLLRDDQDELVHRLGFVSGRDQDKLAALDWRAGATGSPLLADCAGWLDCRVISTLDGGDMTCLLADVVDGAQFEPRFEPLWWRTLRQRMPAAWHAEWDAKQVGEQATARARMDALPPSG